MYSRVYFYTAAVRRSRQCYCLPGCFCGSTWNGVGPVARKERETFQAGAWELVPDYRPPFCGIHTGGGAMEPGSRHEPEPDSDEASGRSPRELKVRVNGSVFVVAKATLTERCEYFRALFQSGMRECLQEEIHIRGLSPGGFSTMLDVLRGDRPILGADRLVQAIECAAFLQVDMLTGHLVNILNSDNCLLAYHAAAEYGLLELLHSAALFIRDMYQDLEEDARSLPPELLRYVESLSPQVFVAVGTHSSSKLQELPHAATRTICYLDEDEKDWKVLTRLPNEASTSMAGVAVLNNKLYIAGGVHSVHKQVVDSCFCYDPAADAWSALAGPRQPRYNFTLVGQEDRLYAIGGEYERVAMSSVETFDISTGSWSFTTHLPRPAAGVACAKTMNRMFVCLWKPMETTEIYEYLPARNEWSLTTTLIRNQSYGHCMVAHRDNLYVMRNGPSDDFLRCVMDCYNLTSGQWTALPGLYANSKGALFTAVVRGDSVFTVNRALTLEYSVEGSRWKPKREMKGFPRSGSMWTFLLRLPKAPQNVSTLDDLHERTS